MSTMGAAAVDAMVKVRFDTTNFTCIVGAPEHGPIDILEDEFAKVVATFKTTRYRRRTGCLALIVDVRRDATRHQVWDARLHPRTEAPAPQPEAERYHNSHGRKDFRRGAPTSLV